MTFYFVKDSPGRQGNRVTIASALSNDYKNVTGKPISSMDEYETIVRIAQDRDSWKLIVQLVVDKYIGLQKAKMLRRSEKRQEAKKRRAT